MNILQIRYFLGIVNSGVSFTKAAQMLYISQPSLTNHIKRLNEELGIELFDTSNRSSIKLTPGGKLLYDFFSEYDSKFRKVCKEAKIANNQTTEIKIVILSGWDVSYMFPLQDDWHNKNPEISISRSSVGYKAIQEGILHHQYDLAVTTSDHFKGTPEVCVKELLSVSWIALYSTRHTLAEKENISIDDFKDDTLYTFSSDEAPHVQERIHAYCKTRGWIPRIKTFDDLESIILEMETGEGYTILDKWMRFIDLPTFKHIELDNTNTVCVVWKKDNPLSPLF
jgi:DNA-binding transcriptional LysR family regulator